MNPSSAPGPAAGVVALAALALAVGLGGGTVLAAAPGLLFRDGPPAAVTGGFGEDSCHACHWDGENDGGGEIRIEGVPERYRPGERYRLRVTLMRPGMAVAGFQLAARHAEGGAQAGELRPAPGEAERMSVVTHDGVQYVQHALAGIALAAPDTGRWAIEWRAPEDTGGDRRVVFHAAGVAGDDDESQIGDFVHTTSARSRPNRP